MNTRRSEPLGTVVLGMHRSGTSTAARLLSLLGLSLGPEDELMPANESNPTGFWESAPLVAANEELLAVLGGHWSAPPRPVAGWESRPELQELGPGAAELIRSTFGADQWVWKDPRLCITFPFWASVVEQPLAVVLVHRNPLEVAASLAARDELPAGLGLALWARYARSALAAARGLTVFVASYESLLADPAGWCAEVAAFLRAQGAVIERVPHDEANAFVRQDLRHTTFDPAALGASPLVADPMRAVAEALGALAGPHASFDPPELPPETPWVEPLLAERRRAVGFESRLQAGELTLAELEARLATIEASRSYGMLGFARALSDAVERRRARSAQADPVGPVSGEPLPEGG